MVYECRLNKVGRQHLFAGVLTIAGLWLLSRFDVAGAGYWWAYAIGIALAIAASYLIGNTRVRVAISGETVTVEHSGMVHANLSVDAIASVAVSGSDSTSRIVVVTSDGSKYYIPCECFSQAEVDGLLRALGKS